MWAAASIRRHVAGIVAFAPSASRRAAPAEYTSDLFWVVLIWLLFSWRFAVTAVPLFPASTTRRIVIDYWLRQGTGLVAAPLPRRAPTQCWSRCQQCSTATRAGS